MVHYPQMRSSEFTFPPEELYLSEFRNRVQNNDVEYGAVYTAVSKLTPVYSKHTVMTFPVILEAVEYPDESAIEHLDDTPVSPLSNLAVISFKLMLLNEDFRSKNQMSHRINMKAGYWRTDEWLSIKESGAMPILGGYLLESLPGDYSPSDVIAGNYFPVDFDL